MPAGPFAHVVGELRRVVRSDGGLSDAALLTAYLTGRDEAAFECLVWRHGPAVLGTCRRALVNEADAEDAFQATFLVFVKKAHTIRPRSAIGAWLRGVACNVARKSRATSLRRRVVEIAGGTQSKQPPVDPDLRHVIDYELNRMPERYRLPIVLCELEEQPLATVARQLGWPLGTVASRLARGRDLLARRLARHVLSISGLTAAGLSAESVAGVLNAVRHANPAVSNLASNVLHSLFLNKVKSAAAVLCATVVMTIGMAYCLSTGETGRLASPVEPSKDDGPKAAKQTLIGRWRVTGERPYRWIEFREQLQSGLLIAEKENRDADWFTWVIDETTEPRSIDVSARVDGKSNRNLGIYKFDGDRLIIYLGAPLQFQGDPGKHTRPTSFDVEGKTGERMLVLERETVAWGKPRDDGLQFGLLAEPIGRVSVQLGESVAFRVLARNTTNNGVDLSVTRAGDTLPGWPIHVRDERGNTVAVRTPVPPAGMLPESAFIRKRLLDYAVVDVGTIHLRFLTSADVLGEPRPIHFVPVALGTYSIRLGGEKSTWGGGGPTGVVKVKVEEAIAWGNEKDGLQFALAFGKVQSTRVHIGDAMRLRLFVRNTTDSAKTLDTQPVAMLPHFVAALVKGKRLEPLRVITTPPEGGLPKPIARTIPAQQTVSIDTEFALSILPFRTGDPGVIGEVGEWDIAYADLHGFGWGGRGYSTGHVHFELLPGDRPHMDGQGVAWGRPSDGVQLGLRADKSEYRIGEGVKFTTYVRNMTDKTQVFHFAGLGHLTVRDAKGAEVPAYRPVQQPKPDQPLGGVSAANRQRRIYPGATVELDTSTWQFLAARPPEAKEPYVVVAPGNYTAEYPDLTSGYAKGSGPPTGALPLIFTSPERPAKPAKP